jgi:hypothetical protein
MNKPETIIKLIETETDRAMVGDGGVGRGLVGRSNEPSASNRVRRNSSMMRHHSESNP